MKFDRVKSDKMLKMARALAGPKKRQKRPRHTWTKGFAAGLEEALALGNSVSIQAKLDEVRQKLDYANVRRGAASRTGPLYKGPRYDTRHRYALVSDTYPIRYRDSPIRQKRAFREAWERRHRRKSPRGHRHLGIIFFSSLKTRCVSSSCAVRSPGSA
jgi:hypothetical protein